MSSTKTDTVNETTTTTPKARGKHPMLKEIQDGCAEAIQMHPNNPDEAMALFLATAEKVNDASLSAKQKKTANATIEETRATLAKAAMENMSAPTENEPEEIDPRDVEDGTENIGVLKTFKDGLALGITYVSLFTLRFNIADNSRDEYDYDDMRANFRRYGVLPEFPILVHKIAEPVDNFVNDLIRGYRRTTTLLRMFNGDDPEDKKLVLTCCGPDLLVPATIYEGLTVDEIADLREDHTADLDRKPLTKIERYRSYIKLRELKDALGKPLYPGRVKPAVKMGLRKADGSPNDSEILQYRNALRVSRCKWLHDEVLKYFKGEKTWVGSNHLSRLAMAYDQDRKAYPNAAFDGNGPALAAAVEKIKDAYNKKRDPEKKKDAQNLTPSSVDDIVLNMKSRLGTRMLNAGVRRSDETIATVDEEIAELEQRIDMSRATLAGHVLNIGKVRNDPAAVAQALSGLVYAAGIVDEYNAAKEADPHAE